MITVVNYDPMWAQTFSAIREVLWCVVEPYAISIEHVGSTSVPGLAAKPVIDIDIVVGSAENAKSAIAALEQAGYKHRGNLGIEGREAFWNPENASPHNLYVCLSTSAAYRNHITLRNCLRADQQLVEQYSALKKRLAVQFPDDIDSYVDGKTDFITAVLRGNGMDDNDVADIDRANRKPAN